MSDENENRVEVDIEITIDFPKSGPMVISREKAEQLYEGLGKALGKCPPAPRVEWVHYNSPCRIESIPSVTSWPPKEVYC